MHSHDRRVSPMPEQAALPALYRGHDALLFTSRYEAWGMPVLEAMAAGLPVVASACLGVQTFAQHGVNALLADPQVLISAVTYFAPIKLILAAAYLVLSPRCTVRR